ncbi:MAG: glycosyltransferase [Bacillota bacterium]|nr:glycosyltransferase [Bacillota bacterium]MDW7684420.1 glycosyltransferase [Bacillota bacterium]
MKKVNIIYSSVNRSNHIIRYGEYFKVEVMKRPDVHIHLVEEEDHIDNILKKAKFDPHFIFFDDFTMNYTMHGLEHVQIPKGVLYWDIHRNQVELRNFVRKNHVDLVFSFYRDTFTDWFPDLAAKFRWLPNFVNIEVFKDYGLKKEIDYLLMGALSEKVYPLRTKIAAEMADVEGFVHHRHPGYRDFLPEEGQLVGESFAREINKAKMFFTDDSIFKYPIAKYFEVPACNTLLLASGSRELTDLGFVDGVTFVEVNHTNYLQKAKYYLKDEDARLTIAQRGYEMVRKKHSTAARTHQFVNDLRTFLARNA